MLENNILPKVLVLILSYNGRKLLDDSVSSYLANDYENFEVMVVDNGSDDGTMAYVQNRWPQVFVLRAEKNLGYSGGLNFGMEYAFGKENADYALITNNDVKADTKLVSALVETAVQSDNTAFTIGKVYYFDKPDTFQTVGKRSDSFLWNAGHIGNKETDQGQYDTIAERAWCDDIYWLVKKEIWEKTGGYDTQFAFQGEDFDWQVRAKQLGYKIMYTPYAKLWHKESMTIGRSSPFKAYYDARNPLIIHMKYRQKEQYLPIVKMRFVSHCKTLPKLILRCRFWYAFKLWQGFFSAIIWGIKHRRLL